MRNYPLAFTVSRSSFVLKMARLVSFNERYAYLEFSLAKQSSVAFLATFENQARDGVNLKFLCQYDTQRTSRAALFHDPRNRAYFLLYL